MFVLDDAMLAAALAAAAETTAAAAPAAIGAAEGAAAAGATMGAAEGASALSPELAGMRLSEAVPQAMSPIGGSFGVEDKLWGQMAKPPTDWKSRMMGGYAALRAASKLVPNKQAKNTLNLMAMTAGAGASSGDPKMLMQTMSGPLNDIDPGTSSQQRLSQALPTPGQRPPAAVPSSPARTPALPPTRLTGDRDVTPPANLPPPAQMWNQMPNYLHRERLSRFGI